MNLSTWAIHKPVPSLALFLVLCLIGMVSFSRLPVTLYPSVDIPIVTIMIAQPGAASTELVSQVVKPVEDSIRNVTGVTHIHSTASDAVAQFTIEFELKTDTDRALNSIKDAISGVRGELPESITEPVVQRLEIVGGPILTYAVSDATQTIEALSYFVDDVVARDLQSAKGVGKISRFGGADREIKVELDPNRLLALGITASQVNAQLLQTNVDLGGGRGDLAGQEFSIRALGSVETVEELAATRLSLADGQTVRLDQLGTVVDGAAETRAFAMFNGQPVVAFGVFRATGASDLDAGDATKEKVAELEETYPNVEIVLISDATVETEGTYESAMETLYEGAILAVLVVFAFLKNWRATLITAVALPLSIIPTFFVMEWLGFSLNLISLLGITLVTGILVDDAIVEIENIVRHIQMGKTAFEASVEAASEIGLTVIAISLTIVAVFVPVSFMDGIIGQFFKQFGLTVAVAVLFSLLVARLITPMIAAYFLKDGIKNEETKDGIIIRTYLRVLKWTLGHRTITLLLGVFIFGLSLYSATLLPQEFDSPTDDGVSNISLELPPGSTLADTRQLAQSLSSTISEVPEVKGVFVSGDGDIARASITVDLGEKSTRERSSFEIEDELKLLIVDTPDVRINFLSSDGGRDVSINIQGDTQEATTAAALLLSREMAGLKTVRNVSTSASLTRPEIQVIPKTELAAQLGITASSLASAIRIATIGESGALLAKFNAGSQQIPISVRFEEEVRRDISQMQGIRIPSSSGEAVPLGVIADITISNGPTSISRSDRQYVVAVDADLAGDFTLGQATDETFALSETIGMPQGTQLVRTGDAELMSEMLSGFATAMGAGIMLVYVVLVILFSSFVTPITILLSLPLAIGGAIFALYLRDYSIGISVIIGFLMLMGIVTKNAIMLVEFALEKMRSGANTHDAITDAGHKRARPIIMTTIAMVAGMVPSALALGTGGEFRAPMAVAVIGGLLTSTMLSLLFVPSLFSVINGLKTWLRHHIVHSLGANQPPKETAK